MSYIIVDANKDDLEFIVSLNKDSMPSVSELSTEKAIHLLKISNYFRILKIKDKPIGFLNAIFSDMEFNNINYLWFKNRYKNFIYVDRIIINKEFQNHGYGAIFYNDLINTINDDFLNIGCEINVKPYNLKSINFHKKFGFMEVGREYIENGKKQVAYMVYKNQ